LGELLAQVDGVVDDQLHTMALTDVVDRFLSLRLADPAGDECVDSIRRLADSHDACDVLLDFRTQV
jgi:hypothetical protein